MDASEGSSSVRAESSSSRSRSGRGNHASVACGSCKGAKKKCDQQQPCSYCTKHNKTCIYDAGQDARRSAVRKRKADDLQYRSQALETILAVLRDSSKPEADRVLNLIRRDASVEDIMSTLQQTPSSRHNSHVRNALSITALIDTPPYQLPTKPWTQVTSDSNVVSHLMSAYFQWVHHFYSWFDEDLFVDAMKSGDANSPYCSSLLVNACLGLGCVRCLGNLLAPLLTKQLWTDDSCAFADPSNPSSRGQHFFDEAHRLWIAAAARPTLVNANGLTMLVLLSAYLGQDRVSMMLVPQLSIMVKQVLSKSKASEHSPEEQRSLRLLEWCHFMVQVSFGLSLMSPIAYPSPTIDAPYTFEELRIQAWSPYPLIHAEVAVNHRAIFNHTCRLFQLGARIQDLVYRQFPELGLVDRFHKGTQMYAELQAEYQTLPARYQCESPEFELCAHSADILMIYYSFCVNCFIWIHPAEPVVHDNNSIDFQVKDHIINFARKMHTITQRFQDEYGEGTYTLMTPQPCNTILHALVGYLGSPAIDEIFEHLFKLFVHSAHRQTITRGLLRVLLGTVDQKRDTVPATLRKNMHSAADGLWNPQDHLKFSSQYPNYSYARETSEIQEMSDLLEKWADLQLGSARDEDGVDGTDEN